jgi:hypothetical protein
MRVADCLLSPFRAWARSADLPDYNSPMTGRLIVAAYTPAVENQTAGEIRFDSLPLIFLCEGRLLVALARFGEI